MEQTNNDISSGILFKVGIIFLFMSLIYFNSCDISDSKYLNEYQIAKIYLLNPSNDSIKYVSRGGTPVFLPDTKRILYIESDTLSVSLWIYNYSNNESKLLLNNFSGNIDDDCISSDENYMVYVKRNILRRINLNTGEDELLATKNDLLSYPPPHYSSDGKKIIYLSNAGFYDTSDSFYVNIYDFNSNNYIILDTIFIRGFDNPEAYFTNDCEKFYIIQPGWAENGYWLLQFILYNNTNPPTPYHQSTNYLAGYTDKFINIKDDRILIVATNPAFDNTMIFTYDVSENILSEKKSLILDPYSIRKIKNSENLIGLEGGKTIKIINYDGVTENIFQPAFKDKIDWVGYSADEKYIFFQNTKCFYY